MTVARLLSIQAGKPQTVQLADGSTIRTSLYKSSVCESVWLGAEDLEGNYQADRRYHGGPDKAVCCYPYEHFPAVAAFLGQELRAGAFGENFTLEGLNEDNVCIGDRYRVGDAIVETSQPRQPCNSLARRWNSTPLLKWLIQNNRTGWYFRVIEEGMIQPGEELTLLERPHPQWTITECNRIMFVDKKNRDALQSLVELPQLSTDWRNDFRKRL